MFLHVNQWKQWMATGEISTRFTLCYSRPVHPGKITHSLAPRREEHMGRRESTTAPSLQMKNITRVVSTKDAPWGRQVLGTQQPRGRQDAVGAPSRPPRSAPPVRWRTALLLQSICTANNRGTFLHLPVQKVPSLLEDSIFVGW